MSINSVNDALDFLPATRTASRTPGILADLREFFRAIGTGLAASHRYGELTARGVPADKAVRMVFDEHFKTR